MPLTRLQWENAFTLIDPQINAEGVHSWPFDPACPADVRFYKYDKRQDIRLNRHDYFEIFYLQQGELICQIQNSTTTMSGGDLAIINSTQYHTMQLPPSRVVGRAKAAALYFMPELIRGTDGAGDGLEYLSPFLIQNASFPQVIAGQKELTEEIFDLLKRIHAELPETSTRARLAVKTYLKMILLLLVNHYAGSRGALETFDRKQRAIEQLQPIFDYLEENYQAPISVQSAAEIMGMSKSHFMRLFKQVTGQPFVNYLNRFRVAKAQSLLATTDLSVSEIGLEVGFCDQSYFGFIFRKLIHLTPLQYRRQCGMGS